MMTKQNILVLKLIQTEFRKREMERLLRLGGQGLSGMGSQSPESSQNDTAEQVRIFDRLVKGQRNDHLGHKKATKYQLRFIYHLLHFLK